MALDPQSTRVISTRTQNAPVSFTVVSSAPTIVPGDTVNDHMIKK